MTRVWIMIMRRADEPPLGLHFIYFFRFSNFCASFRHKIMIPPQTFWVLGSSVTSSRSEPRPFKWSAQINTRLRTGSADICALLLSGFHLARYGFNAFLLNRDTLIYAFLWQMLPFGFRCAAAIRIFLKSELKEGMMVNVNIKVQHIFCSLYLVPHHSRELWAKIS